MITCAEARELLLQADRSELRGGSGSTLGLHLATCDHCRARAARILAAEQALADTLLGARPRHTAPEALRRASARPARRFPALRRAIPLAAAALLAGLLIVRRAGPPLPRALPAPAGDARNLTVAAPPGRSLALLNTANPDVVVVWFFPKEQP
ncbi:MAG TPA: hypothetical protein VFK78_11780 [Gemmatimonadales bacterium]|nr:hypothetical protein [Gemmatimonadales bacterium]